MLKDHLEELRRTKRTLLHTNKSQLRFVDDEDVDSLTLLNSLTLPTPYTAPKSISFDRHALTEREEKKFNLKFVQFLKNLVSEMEHPEIEILLEYLLKVYSIDTFNARELTFLLLPFRKYFPQLQIVATNSKNQFAHLKTYSITNIVKILVRDTRLMLDFVEYFKNYNSLRGFLDRALDEMVEVLKTSSLDYLSEIYRIMEHLIEQDAKDKALEIYHRMRSYLNTLEFVDLLSAHFPAELVVPVNNDVYVSRYQFIHNNHAGRELLRDEIELYKYLTYLRDTGLKPSEFNESEYQVLQHMLFGIKIAPADVSPGDLLGMFSEIDPKERMLKFIVEWGIQEHFATLLTEEDRMFLVGKQFDIQDFGPKNYTLLIGNMDKKTFDMNYRSILDRCLHFRTFDPVHFDTPIEFNWSQIFMFNENPISPTDNIYKLNVLKLCDKFGHDLTGVIFENSLENDPIALSYLLKSPFSPSEEQIAKVLDESKKCIKRQDPTVTSMELLHFACRNVSKVQINDLLKWLLECGQKLSFRPALCTLPEPQLRGLDPEVLYKLFVEDTLASTDLAPSQPLLDILRETNFGVVAELYKVKQYDIIASMANLFGIGKTLISHENAVEFLSKFHSKIDDKPALTTFIIDNIRTPGYQDLLVHFIPLLITFRAHISWDLVKPTLTQAYLTRAQCTDVLDYILQHLRLFDESDQDIFTKLFSRGITLEVKQIAASCADCPTMVDVYLTVNPTADVLPALPVITPHLLKHKKISAISLFKRYGNVMVAYLKQVLTDYPEISDVLVEIEPRFALKELCDAITDENISILMKILKTKICSSADTFKKLCDTFKANFGILIHPIHILALVAFFKNSMSKHSSTLERARDHVADLLASAYVFDPKFIYEMDRTDDGGLSSLFFAFTDCAALMGQNMFGDIFEVKNNVSSDLKFLCRFLEHETIAFEDPLLLCREAFDSKNDLSPKFISYVLRGDPELIKTYLEELLGKIKGRSDVEYALEVLLAMFTLVPESREMKGLVMPEVYVLSEDSEPLVSEKALRVIEATQK